ncbi:MAG: winged helix-turn-helix transcriptional regulator [Candidatus Pacearchaeota archaeon]|nr:winged helix-turn-helix transcriptional regulator [Candidatus Pacearchaeota archaeon]
MRGINWNKILMYICFIYSGIAFEFVYIQLFPLFNNSKNYALPPPPFVYDEIYKTTPSYIIYIVLVCLLGSIISLLAGISLYNINKKKETQIISENWIENITTKDDKKIIDLLKENNSILTQSQIVKESGLTKVKVHRIIQKLKKYNLIEKIKYNQTNKIILKKIN